MYRVIIDHQGEPSALRSVLAGEATLSVADSIAAVRKGAPSRAVSAIGSALMTCFVMPWPIPIAWAAIMCLWEAGARNFFEDRFAAPAALRSQDHGFAWLAAINFVGGLGYTSFPVFAWSTGEPLGFVLATAWVCGCSMHLFAYFSTNRLLMLVTAGPLLIAVTVTPFVAGGLTLTSAIAVAVLVSLIAAAWMFGHDRNALLNLLAKQAVARIAAEHANAAKSQFLATMSHELRTPLNSVIGYAELIEEDSDDKMISEDAGKIRASARQLLGVIDVILDISRLESGAIQLECEMVALSAVVEQLRETAAPLAAANANQLIVTEAGELGVACIDHARVYQCVLQLISNAAKFTHSGEITISAARKTVDGRDSLVFIVSDTGIGVPSDQHQRIFEPFTQLDGGAARRYEGVGMGLALVKRLALLMGGDVRCESGAERGAVFTFWVSAAGERCA